MLCLKNILIAALFCCGCGYVIAEENKSNNEIFFALSKKIIQRTVENAKIQPHTKVSCKILNTNRNTYLRQSIVETLRETPLEVFFGDSLADVSASFNVSTLSINYSKGFSEHFFSGRKTERTISVAIQAEYVERQSNRLVWAETAQETFTDTVDVTSIDELEKSSKGIADTRYGQYSFFDKILEPFVITVASAVAIYLFFTIRS